MTSRLFTNAADIDLSGPPWNVTTVQRVYVLNQSEVISLHTDDACTQTFNPAEFTITKQVSTGLYFYIASGSDAGTEFSDGAGSNPEAVTWDQGSCPGTVKGGKFRADGKAFSMKDWWAHREDETHGFDINVKLPNGNHSSVGLVEGVDPTIVERGQEPPPEH